MPLSLTPEEYARFRLARTEGLGPVSYRRLNERFSSPVLALEALPELAKKAGRKKPFILCPESALEKELKALDKLGAHLVFAGTPAYPPLLEVLNDAPPVLVLIGRVELLSGRQVAVVGARNASVNGLKIAGMLASGLAEAGLGVTSGLARGIDGAAHRAALAQGAVIAVIPGGPDIFYPEENAALQREIAEKGLIVAESPVGTAPLARHFPKRNRIIAGLSLGVTVIEAALHSGSLLTAETALDLGRDIFAVPGHPLDPRNSGCNNLIRQGAFLTETVNDILNHLPENIPEAGGLSLLSTPPARHLKTPLLTDLLQQAPSGPAKKSDGFSEEIKKREQEINPLVLRELLRQILSPSPTNLDDLIRYTKLSPSLINSLLFDMELANEIEILPGNRIILTGDFSAQTPELE